MKRAVFFAAAMFAAFSAFGKGATQEWVRRYVLEAMKGVVRQNTATNLEAEAAFSASAIVDPDSSYTANIKAGAGTFAALKVVESTVPEIPAGTFYARDAQGCYRNAKNGCIDTIYASAYTVSRPVTNAMGAASVSSVRMGNFWAVDSTGRAWRMGIAGDTILYLAGERSKYIAIRSTTLPDRAANYLMPAANAGLTVRDMLALAFPAALAKTEEQTVYTINSETTIAINTITFTRTNKFTGKVVEYTFTPKDLQGVYKGPNGPFESKEAAREAASNLDNWDFGDWITTWNVEGFSTMTRADLQNSDVWKQLIEAIGTERVEVEIENPQPYEHPCPAPADYWELDPASGEWVVSSKYGDGEKLDAWRGANGCKCEFVGCENEGVSRHRVGRAFKDGEKLEPMDDETADGCKCCVRCVKYGSAPYETIDEFDDHRGAGVDAGYCGCACGRKMPDTEEEWTRDFHNYPSRVGGLDFACLCYCAKDRAQNGEFVRHVKYSGDSPWCKNICGACGMVEDEEQYVTFPWPSFDLRQVTLRESEWTDHTPRSEVKDGVSVLNDPTYYDRCGCACSAYDEDRTAGLPAEFASFHQMKDSSCRCHCGQSHNKNKIGDEAVDPFPCEKICAVCLKVEDEESSAVFRFGGDTYKKISLVDPEDEKYHDKHLAVCGCKCYNGEETRHEWSVGDVAKGSISSEDGKMPEWHVMNASGCGCFCGGVIEKTLGKAYHIGPNETKGVCWCKCGENHLGEWLDKKCGAKSWRECSLNAEHIHDEDVIAHEWANKYLDASSHFCKCDRKALSPHQNSKQKSGRGEGFVMYRLVCQTPGCGWFGDETEICNHPSWGEWFKAGDVAGGGVLMRRNCADCASYEEEILFPAEMTECIEDMNIHLPLEDKCGCKCGHYGVRIAESEDFHKWDAAQILNGVANCRCQCEQKHHFRAGSHCPDVCAYCRRTLKSGRDAKETDHIQASGHVCGCACGYYGVTAEHVASGHNAELSFLHKQATTAGNGAPAFCQCYGATGKGGKWHWRINRSSTCPKICKYTMEGDKLGHLAAWDSPEKIVTAAKASDHVGNAYGCGCKCGLCGDETKSLWADEKALHKPAQNAEDQCHCSCEKRHLVGDGAGGHTFKDGCICTCGAKHDPNKALNACGYCSGCGSIWRGGERQDATVTARHFFANSGCYCDGGCVVQGSRILHPDGHMYPAKSCRCVCGETTLAHIVIAEKEPVGTSTCWDCYAVFVNYYITTFCARCGETLESGKVVGMGEHYPECGQPKPSCWKCGCHCATRGTHATCNTHYCNSCCTTKPKKPPRDPLPSPDDPNPEPSPEPPEPYTDCTHLYTISTPWDYNETCTSCEESFHFWGNRVTCNVCGQILENNSYKDGAHSSPCTDGMDGPNDQEPEYVTCHEELSGGGECGAEYQSGSGCPNASSHKSHHGGNGGSGGGGLDDI